MMWQRRFFYPPNWPQLATDCKSGAGWRCQSCHIRQGAWRRSKRTGKPYRVWLHAAHNHLHDTLNPQPALRCLCPSCHGRYDYRLRQREARIALERYKHRRLLSEKTRQRLLQQVNNPHDREGDSLSTMEAQGVEKEEGHERVS